MILMIFRPIRSYSLHYLFSALVDKELCQIQVMLLPRQTGQLHQRHFYFGMAAGAFSFPGTEYGFDMVDQTNDDPQQTFIACGTPEGNRGLYEMTRTIELVTEVETRPFPLRLHHLIVTVQIAIGLLRRSEEGNHFVCLGL